MSKVKLSITIVSYNNSNDVAKLIDNIETYTSIEISKKIYIIDNADERNAYEAIADNYPDIEYIYTGKNLGFGKGHNYIINDIDSEYHAIVNPDISLFEDSFSKIIEFMNLNPDIGMVIPKMVDQNGNIQSVYRRELTVYDMFIRMFCKEGFKKRKAYHTMQDMNYSEPFQVPFAQGSFLVIRTKLFKELKGFDENFFMYVEDADLCKRVNQVSSLFYFPGTTVVHKWEKGSHKNSKLFKYHLASMRYYFNKWGWKLR